MSESAPLMTDPASSDGLFIEHLASVSRALELAMERNEIDRLVIHAGLQRMAFRDDQPYPYRPNPWFSYFVPVLDAPGSLLEWTLGRQPRLRLVVPNDYWHSPPHPPIDPWVKQFDVEVHTSPAEALRPLAAAADPGSAWIGEPAPPEGPWRVNPPALLAELEDRRTRKTPYELACIREASRRAVAGHRAAARAFEAGASEYAIHLAYLAATGHTDNELPYGNIVALNENAATLHYQLLERTAPAERRSLLIDAGASCGGYAADITRTWTATPGGSFATLVRRMDSIQQTLCREVRIGVDWRDLHLRAHHEVAVLLAEMGVLRVTPDTAVAQGISGTFLPHGLGHLLGLQVHDVGGFRNLPRDEPVPPPAGHPHLRLTRRLEKGFVVTVEPGIYFIPSLLDRLRAGPFAAHVDWQLVDRLRPFGGVRIEDDVLVTANGQENLTRAAFAS